MSDIWAVGADEHDQQAFLAAEIVATHLLARNNIGEQKIGRAGTQLKFHGRFGECHFFLLWVVKFAFVRTGASNLVRASRLTDAADLKESWLSLMHSEPEVLISQPGRDTAARRTVQESDLNQKRLVDLF